jgi:hypothetical protein
MGTIVDAVARFATPEWRLRDERARAELARRIHEFLNAAGGGDTGSRVSTQYLTRFTVSFRTPRGMTGRIQVETTHRFQLSYRLAGLGQTLETVTFGTLDETCAFLARIGRIPVDPAPKAAQG